MIIPLDQLTPFEHNPRNITPQRFAELKDRITLKRQYKPLVVTPSPDGSRYIVLGGNMRLRALKELGVEGAVCTIVEFFDQDGIWRSKVDGVETQERFNSREHGMMDWNLADNDEFGYTDATLFADIMSGFPEIDLKKHALVFDEVQSIEDFIKQIAPDEEDKPAEPFTERLVKCPDCGAEFDPTKNTLDTDKSL